jgi:hypothetical protein
LPIFIFSRKTLRKRFKTLMDEESVGNLESLFALADSTT